MTKDFKNIDNALDIESKIVESVPNVDILTNHQSPDQEVDPDIKKDYDYTRGNLYSLIEKGQEAINGILELAQETDQPRAYEVAGQLIKSVADATDKLLDLQKKMKEVQDSKDSKSTTNVTNALFVGSTADLAKLLKQTKMSNENV